MICIHCGQPVEPCPFEEFGVRHTSGYYYCNFGNGVTNRWGTYAEVWVAPAIEDRICSPSGLCLQFMCNHELSPEGMCILE